MYQSALGSHAHDTAVTRKRRRRAQLTLALAAAGVLFAGAAVQTALDQPGQGPAAYAYFSN